MDDMQQSVASLRDFQSETSDCYNEGTKYCSVNACSSETKNLEGTNEVWYNISEKLDRVSVHGIFNLVNARGLFKKVFWSVAFLCMFTGLILNTILLIRKYSSYSVDINYAIITRKQAPFPSVTVCNLHPYKNIQLKTNANDTSPAAHVGERRIKRQSIKLATSKENIALHMKAYQSSTCKNHPMDDANRAVDGKTSPRLDEGECAHGGLDRNERSWLMIDLQNDTTFKKIILYHRSPNECL
ncbi:hypothetical protein HELRODRAFT_160286 [Helobdella robusta]|uniref:F5/8 type C domain-containing protein n=1 Tax=Helobdella robusta TaxID=6412 RepID=T1EQ21_HELRO|nr:hypothetical protein HELRODRAFT_160286 [Helobdella robusta]ESO06140.1 hypothetical protein HELRODRAFT_160286 [Helobdella robusta]